MDQAGPTSLSRLSKIFDQYRQNIPSTDLIQQLFPSSMYSKLSPINTMTFCCSVHDFVAPISISNRSDVQMEYHGEALLMGLISSGAGHANFF